MDEGKERLYSACLLCKKLLSNNLHLFISYQEHQPASIPASFVLATTSLGSTGSTPPDSRNTTPLSMTASASASTGSPFKDKIIAALNIPIELTDHTDPNLGYAWQKYHACTEAVKACNLLWDQGKLKRVFDRKPTQADIISVFKGKSQYHLRYKKAFTKVSKYPTMVAWLEDRDDKLSDVELWGILKPAYLFSDLFEWLENGGEGLTKVETEVESEMEETQKRKGKGKEKAKEKGKGKGKDKDKEKGKDKGKERASKPKEGKNTDKSKDKGKGKAKEVTGGNKKKKSRA